MQKQNSRTIKIATLLFAGVFVIFAGGCIVIPDEYGYYGDRGHHGHHRHHDYYHDGDGYQIRKYR